LLSWQHDLCLIASTWLLSVCTLQHVHKLTLQVGPGSPPEFSRQAQLARQARTQSLRTSAIALADILNPTINQRKTK
jgi:hypothetical protein